jgi:hypothetical protein
MGKIKIRKPSDDPSLLGFPMNPRATSKLDELKGNETWLGGIVDWGLLLLSTKRIWNCLGRIGDNQALVFQ